MRYITFTQIAISLLLIVSILLQNRGSGLSTVFGGDFGGYYTKRGMEKFLFYFSILLAAAFIALAVANFILANG